MSRRSIVYGFGAVMLLRVIALLTPSSPTIKTSGAAFQQTAPATAPAVGSKTNPLLNPCTRQPFATIMTGAGMSSADAGIGPSGTESQYVVNFTLASNDEAAKFSTFTSTHIGQPVAIVLDGQVVSAPVVRAALTTGGQITGN